MIEQRNTEQFRRELPDQGRITVVEFYTDGCPACKTMTTLLEKLSADWHDRESRVRFWKVNVGEERELMNEYAIRSVPTLMVFREVVREAESVGAVGRSKVDEMIRLALERAYVLGRS